MNSQRLTRILGVLLAWLCTAQASAWGAEEKPLVCEGTLDKVKHRMSVTVSNERIEKFQLFSVEPKRGHDCSVEASRDQSKDQWVTSIWDDMPDGTSVVTVFDRGEMLGTVSLKKNKGKIEIHLGEPRQAGGYCGLNGMIARTLILTQGQKKCTLKWD